MWSRRTTTASASGRFRSRHSPAERSQEPTPLATVPKRRAAVSLFPAHLHHDADPPRQQVPLPPRRGRGVHGGPGGSAGRCRSHGRVLRDGASAQHPPGIRRALSRAHRARAASADPHRTCARRRANAVLDVGEPGHGCRPRGLPPGRRAPPQHLPPAVALGAAPRRAAARPGGDDTPRLQARLPDLSIPRPWQSLPGLPRGPLPARGPAPMQGRFTRLQRGDGG